jgi:hypothetical protein
VNVGGRRLSWFGPFGRCGLPDTDFIALGDFLHVSFSLNCTTFSDTTEISGTEKIDGGSEQMWQLE